MVLRRWDGVGDPAVVYSDAGTPGMNLGDGVHVQFGGHDLRAGDYWQFTSRTIDGSVQPLVNAAPAGIARSRAPLALVTWGPPPPTSPPAPDGTVAMNMTKCLPTFPALINFPPIDKGFHIVGLSAVDFQNKATQLFNDSNVQVNSFSGINIQCDADVDPASVSRPTCFVMIEYPLATSDAGAGAYFPIVLAGEVNSNGNVISWKAGDQAQALLTQLLTAALNERGLLGHLIVKGSYIWSKDDPTLFLDGEAFGQPPQGGNTNISLQLPSGDRRRGGDFEMWFWVVAAPSFVTAIEANPPSPINVGDTTTLTITLSSPAPAGKSVTLTGDSASVSITGAAATSPPAFTVDLPVQAGATSLTVTAKGDSVGATNLSASFGGQTVALTLVVQPLPQLTGTLSLNPLSVFVGGTSTGSVTISGPAPQNGLAVTLSSDPASGVAQLSSGSITVPAGATTASFSVTGVGAGTATISATATNSVSALFTVVQRKGKEIIDKAQRKESFDKVQLEKVAEKALEKLTDKVAREVLPQFRGTGVNPATEGNRTNAPEGAAFIRIEERPAVGVHPLNTPPSKPKP